MSDKWLFSGAVVMTACACGTSAGIASIANAAGGTTFPPGPFYAAIVAVGVLLFLLAISSKLSSLIVAIPAALALLGAGLLAPPRVMRDDFAHASSHLIGFFLYIVAAALVVWAVLRHYRPAATALAGMSLAGVAVAVGCTCCLTPGAFRYLAFAGFNAPSWIVSRLAFVLIGVALCWFALKKSNAPRSAKLYLIAGALLLYPIEKGVEALVPVWDAGGMNLTFLLRYPVWLAGTALVIYAASRPLVAATRKTSVPGVSTN